MNQEGYIEAFHTWIRRNEPGLNACGITVQVPEKIVQSGTHADFFSQTGEATVEVWDYGFSEFHVVDWKAADTDADYQAEVTHHEFQNEGELFAALDSLVKRMSQARKAEAVEKTPAGVGGA